VESATSAEVSEIWMTVAVESATSAVVSVADGHSGHTAGAKNVLRSLQGARRTCELKRFCNRNHNGNVDEIRFANVSTATYRYTTAS
jgi:hypothetical protein